MEDYLNITALNDYIFCPISIYYHHLLQNCVNEEIYTSDIQQKGKYEHQSIDQKTYSTSKNILQGINVYSEQYRVYGKIDLLDVKSRKLIERKRKIKVIYDGYIFQLYAQYFALIEMGYEIDKIQLYSSEDHRTYDILLPYENKEYFCRFVQLRKEIDEFEPSTFVQENIEKCKYCIYHVVCGGSYDDE